MRADSRVQRFEVFVSTATVGAHSNAIREGFRLREVKFLTELFTNWGDSSLSGSATIQTTQISRYLDSLCREGYARRIGRSVPHFRLTRTGLIEVLSRLVSRTYYPEREQFFFLIYFVRSYKPRITELVEAEGRQFPPALRIELEDLLNAGRVIDRELEHCERERRKLATRIRDARSTSDLTKSRMARGAAFADVVAEAEERYPYELNSQKPLSELIASIPERQRRWELEVGNVRRASLVWEPSMRLLESYVRELEALRIKIEAP